MFKEDEQSFRVYSNPQTLGPVTGTGSYYGTNEYTGKVGRSAF